MRNDTIYIFIFLFFFLSFSAEGKNNRKYKDKTGNRKSQLLTTFKIIADDVKWNAIGVLYDSLKKEVYESTLNPIKYISTIIYRKSPEFGWIEAKQLKLDFDLFLGMLGFDAKKKIEDINFSKNLAGSIAQLLKNDFYKSHVTKMSALVYRLLENNMIPSQNNFLEYFVTNLEKDFRTSFYLLNFQNFLNCDQKLVHLLIEKVTIINKEQAEKNLINEFVQVYELFLDGNKISKDTEKKETIEKTLVASLKTGALFSSMYLIYWASTVFEVHPNLRWSLDNIILNQVNGFLTSVTQDTTSIKNQQYIQHIKFGLVENGNLPVASNNMINFGKNLVQKAHTAEGCFDCKIRKQLLEAKMREIEVKMKEFETKTQDNKAKEEGKHIKGNKEFFAKFKRIFI